MLSKVFTAAALAGSLLVGGAAFATTSTGTGTTSTTVPATTSTTTATPVRVDNGTDYGWLGLIGLAGLAGLLRRKDPVVHTTTAHTGTSGAVHRS